jgi:hypothetical protein
MAEQTITLAGSDHEDVAMDASVDVATVRMEQVVYIVLAIVISAEIALVLLLV